MEESKPTPGPWEAPFLTATIASHTVSGCGCEILSYRKAGAMFRMCAMHKAAEDLLKVAEIVLANIGALDAGFQVNWSEVSDMAKRAIAKAEGRP